MREILLVLLLIALLSSPAFSQSKCDWEWFVRQACIQENVPQMKQPELLCVPDTVSNLSKAVDFAYERCNESTPMQEFAATVKEGGWTEDVWIAVYGGQYKPVTNKISMGDEVLMTVAKDNDGLTKLYNINKPPGRKGMKFENDAVIKDNTVEILDSVRVDSLEKFNSTS
jgi:hypothetical protein